MRSNAKTVFCAFALMLSICAQAVVAGGNIVVPAHPGAGGGGGGGGGGGATAPVTVDNESATISGARQLVNGTGTTVDTGTAHQIKINATGSAPGGTSGDIQTNNGSGGFGAVPRADFAASGTNADITQLTALTGAQTGGFFGGAQTVSTATGTLSATSASLVKITYSAGACTVTLPDATTCAGKVFVFSQATYNTDLFLQTVSSQTIGGANASSGLAFLCPTGQTGSAAAGAIISDGSNWMLLGVPGIGNNQSTNGGVAYWYENSLCSSAAPATGMALLGNSGVTGAPQWGTTVYTNVTVSSSQSLGGLSSKYVNASASSAPVAITLTPTANKEWVITRTDGTSNALTVAAASGSLIGPGGSLSGLGDSKIYWSDGTNIYTSADIATSYSAGTGISISGNTINNAGVTGISGSSTITASASTGNVTLSIPSNVALAGSPTTTTQTSTDNSTKVATTAFVQSVVSGIGGGSVTSVSSGNLTGLFSTSVATSTSTPSISYSASAFSGHTFWGNNTGSSATGSPVTISTADLSDFTTTPSAVGQIPIANSSNKYAPATLTAGSGISISNASGSVTISATGGGSTSNAATPGNLSASVPSTMASSGVLPMLPPTFSGVETGIASFVAPSSTSITAVTGICQGPDGAVWMSCAGSGSPKVLRFFMGNMTSVTLTANASSICAGPDGNLWGTEANSSSTNRVFKITPSGSATEYSVPTSASSAFAICSGPDGNLWGVEATTNKVFSVTTSGTFTEYTVTTGSSNPSSICAGPDGNLWGTEYAVNKIFKVTTGGAFTEYTIPTSSSHPSAICAGPDGNLWGLESATGKVFKSTTSGAITEYANSSGGVGAICVGPDGALWGTEPSGNKLFRLTVAGVLIEYALPTLDSSDLAESICSGSDGNLYVGNSDGSLNANFYRVTLSYPISAVPLIGGDGSNVSSPFSSTDTQTKQYNTAGGTLVANSATWTVKSGTVINSNQAATIGGGSSGTLTVATMGNGGTNPNSGNGVGGIGESWMPGPANTSTMKTQGGGFGTSGSGGGGGGGGGGLVAGGAGGNAGGGAAAGAGGSGWATIFTGGTTFDNYEFGGGAGGGGASNGAGGSAGAGNGRITLNVNGNLTIASGASLNVNGASGGNGNSPSANASGAGGGGGGGRINLNVNGNLTVTGTITATGGAGGTGGSQGSSGGNGGGGGGGGGGGQIDVIVSGTITGSSNITANGGALGAGGTGTGTNGSAGTAGTNATVYTATGVVPNFPLISMFDLNSPVIHLMIEVLPKERPYLYHATGKSHASMTVALEFNRRAIDPAIARICGVDRSRKFDGIAFLQMYNYVRSHADDLDEEPVSSKFARENKFAERNYVEKCTAKVLNSDQNGLYCLSDFVETAGNAA